MKPKTKMKLFRAWKYCDVEDKSTEFMLEYMQDEGGVDLDCVLNFIDKYHSWTACKSLIEKKQ